MAMSTEQAKAIVEREGAAVRLFVKYLNDPGIQLHFRVGMMAVADNRKEGKLLYKLYRKAVQQLKVLEGVGLTAAAPALVMLTAIVSELFKDIDHDEAVFPSALIPSDATVEACLTLFHEKMGYPRNSDGPQDAPADAATTPSSYEES